MTGSTSAEDGRTLRMGRWFIVLSEMAERLRSKREESYAIALLIFGAAAVARFSLDFIFSDRSPFITFFPAVLLSSYLCGLWPGTMVLILSALTGALWPQGEPALFRVVSFALFLVIGSVNIALVYYVERAVAGLRARDEQLALINRELKHRIKNLFSITNAICQQTLKSGTPIEDMSKAISGRIQAVAAAQDLLSVTATQGARLHQLVEALVASLSPESSRLRVSGTDVILPVEATTPFALILHELGTNAIKYGAWSTATDGRVDMSWTLEDRELVFCWRERDGLAIAPPLRAGFGSKLIKEGLNGASVQHDLRPDGLQCVIRMRLED